MNSNISAEGGSASGGKKVLLVTRPLSPPWDEGSKNFAYFLAKNVSGVEMNIMTKSGETLPDLPKNVREHHVYTTSEIADFNFVQKIRSILFQFFHKGKFDIVHYFFTPTKLNSFVIKNFLLSTKTKTIQTVATLREDLWSDKDLKKLLFADLLITYSDYSKEKLEKLGFQNVRRIYPGIDTQKYNFQEKNSALLQKFGFDKNDFVINFTGEYVRLDAIDNIIESFVEIAKKIPHAKLSLAVRIKNEKDKKKKQEIIQKLKQENLLEKVSFHDDGKYEMSEIYNLCDASLFPVKNMSGKFDIPLVVVEAMASKKPVILSNLPILRELGNSENSVIIEKTSPEKISEAILDLYNNPEKRKMIGQSARKFVQDNFDIKKQAKIYEEIYKSLQITN